MALEHGIMLGGPAFLGEAVKTSLDRFSWIYLGSEFCENLLETRSCAEAARFQKMGKKVCLLTPPLTRKGVASLTAVFRGLLRLADSGRLDADRLELTLNDFGALELAAREKLPFRLGAGRLLFPNVFVRKKETLEILNQPALDFFARRGIRRYELSTTGARLRTNFDKPASGFPPVKFNFSLYYPYLSLTTTRTCLVGMPHVGPGDAARGVECGGECRACAFRVSHPWIKEKLLVRGNTVFLEFPEKFYSSKKELAGMRVDRLIYCPFP